MRRGLAIIGTMLCCVAGLCCVTGLCCVAGCIGKADSTASNSTVAGPDVSPPGVNQGGPAADDPQVVQSPPEPAEFIQNAEVPVTEVISFDDLNLGLDADVRFREFMLVDKRARELIDKRVNIGGYIGPTERMRGITDFVLLRNVECKFGPGGQADHLVHVFMPEDAATDFTDKVVYVEGTLKLNPFHAPDGSATWSIFDLHGVSASTTPPRRNR